MSIRLADLAIREVGASHVSRGPQVELSIALTAPRLGWNGARLWFRVPRELAPATTSVDPFLVALLLPAMAAHLDLQVAGPASPSLLANLDRLQAVVTGGPRDDGWERLHAVTIAAPRGTEPAPGSGRTALFFSGGVDSFYSLLRAEAETGHRPDLLVFVQGFDVPLGATTLASSMDACLRRAADAAGLPLIIVETNLREVLDPLVGWELLHGGGLAAVGHLLGHAAQHWLLSSTGFDQLSKMTDAIYARWSSDRVTLLTVGLPVSRAAKLTVVGPNAVARRSLIVCWQARIDATNCGRCSKCVSTALQLLVQGDLAHVVTLPHQVEPAHVHALQPDHTYRESLWLDVSRRLRAREEWTPLAEAVESLIARSRRADRSPRASDILTAEGRAVALEWLRRWVKPRLPVGVRMRLVRWQRRSRR